MKLFLVTTEPIQEIAAEPGTLDQLTASLRALIASRQEEPATTASLGSLVSWPLVADARLRPGVVHLRPFPEPPEEVPPCDSAS